MSMGYVERLILSNGLALVCFPLVVFNNIRTNRGRMLKLSTAMMMLTIAVYAIIGCFDAVASTLFSVLRNYACLKFDGRKGGRRHQGGDPSGRDGLLGRVRLSSRRRLGGLSAGGELPVLL
jgi:hypothetical protein